MVTIHSSLNSLTESSLLRRRSFLASLAAIGLAACSPEDTVSSHGNGEGLSQYPIESLNEAEEAGILQLREEEKLARDVYTLLEEKWGLSAFSQIKPSEQKHMDAVAKLINRYDLLDPAQESIGSFENQKISSLFETLMTKGEQSEVDALQVGMTVEDVDIYDIDEILSKNDNQDIQVVFTNLRNGSIKHLQRFYTDLKTLGGTYEPQYISQELFDQLTIGI
ncbi:MAG: DUF2202 domain-containing protein [Deltaproteobacteria bacterium]